MLSLALFAPFLGAVRLFDWDEINFAECAREMIVTGDYLHVTIDYRPFYEKPPLFIWAQVLSMKVFGINEYAARFPNALIGMITMVVIFSIGTRLHGERMGWLWTLAYAGSLLPHFYFRSGIIDPMFNLFIFLAVYWLISSLQGAWLRNSIVAGVFAACAVMTKGPVGFGLAMLTFMIGWFVLRRQYTFPFKQILIATAVMTVLSSLWFVVDYVQNGPTFVMENLRYQVRLLTTGDAGHEQPFWYHPVVVLLGCFPSSILLFGGLRKTEGESNDQRTMRIFMIVLMCVVLIVFSIVKTKIIHYSSMTYLPLTYLAALYMDRYLNGSAIFGTWKRSALLVFGTVWSFVVFGSLWAFMDRNWLTSLPTFRDPFLRSSIMRNVEWNGSEPAVGMFILVGVLGALLLARKTPSLKIWLSLYGGVILFVTVALPFVTPKIEPYTQGAALDFYESMRGKDVYIQPVSFKTYAHLFYQQKPPSLSGAAKGVDPDKWFEHLLNDSLDKKAYFVSKVNNAEEWRNNDNLVELYEEGGFVFFTKR